MIKKPLYDDPEAFIERAREYEKNARMKQSNRKVIKEIEYAFNEDELIKEIQNYIDATYNEHYAGGKYQATDIIIDAGHGIGFTLGNVIKYAKRYGKKEGFNRKDLLKMIHYGILALAVHDKEKGNHE
jgi:membrane-anchored protein YejM (alkaline phosphatase superfamily)